MHNPIRSLLVLGGARSGKSGFAQSLAARDGRAVTLIATAEAGDDEMAARIAKHQQDRPTGFTVMEEPLALAETLTATLHPARIVLVDCLTLWLTNIMLAGRDVEVEMARLCGVITAASGSIILVSNEVGQGIVPQTPLGRAFRDHQGRVNAQVAQAVDGVVMMVAGLPLWLKPQAEHAREITLR